jgi:hypothetical protein
MMSARQEIHQFLFLDHIRLVSMILRVNVSLRCVRLDFRFCD